VWDADYLICRRVASLRVREIALGALPGGQGCGTTARKGRPSEC